MSVTLHTSLGDIKLELFCDEAPKASENFLGLSASGSYDGTIFHRNMKGFMIQGGDPSGTGRKSKSMWGGKFEDEIDPEAKFVSRGQLAMATSQANTNGSQFFITYAEAPHLNQTCTVFGKVIHGDEVLDKMEAVPVGAKDRPVADIVLKSTTIHANPFAD
ncbi:hypothetical protein NDN08_000097 [Rhodosorus marinus]|uniref:Peptidyl-prolyl cis-trans isomerase n=1 Tax=Rhodosorus marinus TaxID=101924 RepID=A0AAV8UHK3_9RHOD|nr:hypothetical protein NDN08_000097 [Rhodosorus marinus]